MSTIDVRRTHTLPREEARRRAEELARTTQQRFDLEWHWEGDRIVFEARRGAAKGTRGSVDVSERDVRVQIDLPLMLRVMKSAVESKVQEKLGKALSV
jgi:putative polyhydroxyalkanoate system protein